MKMTKLWCFLLVGASVTSCVSKKKYTDLENQHRMAQERLDRCEEQEMVYQKRMDAVNKEKTSLDSKVRSLESTLSLREEQMNDLRDQISDLRMTRDKQLDQVGDLTVLSKSANDNINKTLEQLEKRDEYIYLLQAARTKADSLNLALAVNLKSVLSEGISDEDVEVKVDKTVVFVNLSDKMLYNSGSSMITQRAKEVLGKIAMILRENSNLEVMVEGYTDNIPISNDCIQDNWDLSVKRATSVIRVLQKQYDVDPNRLIAAGRGEYNTLASNDTSEGRKTNRRTRIIILPKLDQFYDLLNPDKVASLDK